jgi:hypothetical protein
MKKIAKHKLSLDTTVIRELSTNQMGQVVGASGQFCGVTVITCAADTSDACCGSPTYTCSGPLCSGTCPATGACSYTR